MAAPTSAAKREESPVLANPEPSTHDRICGIGSLRFGPIGCDVLGSVDIVIHQPRNRKCRH